MWIHIHPLAIANACWLQKLYYTRICITETWTKSEWNELTDCSIRMHRPALSFVTSNRKKKRICTIGTAPINTLKNQSIKFHLMHPEPTIHHAIPFHSIGIGCNWYTAVGDDLIRAMHGNSINPYWMFFAGNRHAKVFQCNRTAFNYQYIIA